MRPNLLFFITDDMYPHMFNFLPEGRGRNLTPNLDRLAREGTILLGQHVASSVCTPARYNCLTGRYASRAQSSGFVAETARLGQAHVQWNTFIDPDRERTVAQRLRDAGYRTGFVGKDHVVDCPDWKAMPLSSSIEDPAVIAQIERNRIANERALHRAGFEFVDRVFHNNPDFNGSRALAVQNQDWITEGALDFLAHTDERPFFLYFATTIPHGPTEAERSWNANRRATPYGMLDCAPTVQPDAADIARRAREAGLEGNENVIWIDDALGVVLDELESRDLLRNTIIFFLTDHGQSAKGSLYEGGIHNPGLVWRHGGWTAGSTADALVSNIDFAPTLLQLAGAEISPDMDGRSLLPILEGKETTIHDALFFEMGYSRAVIRDGWKYLAVRYPPAIAGMSRAERQKQLDHLNNNLRDRGLPIHNTDPMAPFSHLMPVPGGHDADQDAIHAYPHYHDSDQLYDLQTDPQEQRNLAGDPAQASRLVELRSLLAEHLATMPGGFGELAPNELVTANR